MSQNGASNTRVKAPPLQELKKKCEELAHIEPKNTNKMASLLQDMSLRYYEDVRTQAQQSFRVACLAAAVGTILFVYAAYRMMEPGPNRVSSAVWGLLPGALVQVISGINFYLYGKAARQFGAFHVCLERTNRFLLANTLCENLNCPTRRDEVRTQLIQVVANAPMLTLDVVAHGAPEQQLTQSSWTRVREYGEHSNNGMEAIEGQTSKVVTSSTAENS
jgi:hypothetical protein